MYNRTRSVMKKMVWYAGDLGILFVIALVLLYLLWDRLFHH